LNQFSYEEFWEIEDIKQIVPVITYDQFRKIEPTLGADYKVRAFYLSCSRSEFE